MMQGPLKSIFLQHPVLAVQNMVTMRPASLEEKVLFLKNGSDEKCDFWQAAQTELTPS